MENSDCIEKSANLCSWRRLISFNITRMLPLRKGTPWSCVFYIHMSRPTDSLCSLTVKMDASQICSQLCWGICQDNFQNSLSSYCFLHFLAFWTPPELDSVLFMFSPPPLSFFFLCKFYPSSQHAPSHPPHTASSAANQNFSSLLPPSFLHKKSLNLSKAHSLQVLAPDTIRVKEWNLAAGKPWASTASDMPARLMKYPGSASLVS